MKNRHRARIAATVLAVLAMAELLSWRALGRTHLAEEVPTAISRDLRAFSHVAKDQNIRWPPFYVLLVEGLLSPSAKASLERVLAREGIRLATASPPTSASNEVQPYSYTVLSGAPLLGSIDGWYGSGARGVSMNTTFVFVLGVWLPLTTKATGAP
jgi:hypothetical protein